MPVAPRGVPAWRSRKHSLPISEGAFPRAFRLLKPDDYRRVFSDNRRSADRYFLLLARPNGLDHGRLGLAISKKKTRRAVDRNRLKRLVRESFRTHRNQLAGLDIVVINRTGRLLVDNQVYFDSLASHWRRLSERCANP